MAGGQLKVGLAVDDRAARLSRVSAACPNRGIIVVELDIETPGVDETAT